MVDCVASEVVCVGAVGSGAPGPAMHATVGEAPVRDDWPCVWCGNADGSPAMVLCDRCDKCFHRDCATTSGGTQMHAGPWFCEACKGELVMHGFPDVT